ncbi:MAG: hypothetical protein Q8L20_10890 [Gammaproteobacteria bacterium]|nr:hypothetical protein [Gammaproteobacteria bacterium]
MTEAVDIKRLKRQYEKLREEWLKDKTPQNFETARKAASELRAARQLEEAREEEKATMLMSSLQERTQQPVAPHRKKKQSVALVDPEDRKPGRGTGVKHIRPTISGFSHPPADKSESLLTRLNLRSNDPLSACGGSGTGLTAGEILSAFAFELVPAPNVEKLIGRYRTKKLACDLAIYKHLGDFSVHASLVQGVWDVAVAIAKREGWSKAESDSRPLEFLEKSLSVVVIEHICAPAMFRDLSDRRWAQLLDLPGGHREWDRKWESRYRQIINAVQDAEIAGEEQIRRRV